MDSLSDKLTADPKLLSRADPAPPCTLVIFGAGGDLTKRLLMPSLYNMTLAGLFTDEFGVVGVDLADYTDESFRKYQSDTMQGFVAHPGGEFHAKSIDPAKWGWLESRLHYMKGDFAQDATFAALKDRLTQFHGNCVFYLAVADRFFGPIVDMLAKAGLLEQKDGAFRRVVVEKPFGHDLQSAKDLNARLLKDADESQIFRIDHFLGKETVQNIMAFRFSATPCSSRSGTATISTTSRSPPPRRSASSCAASSTRSPGHCATWCPTTCSSCSGDGRDGAAQLVRCADARTVREGQGRRRHPPAHRRCRSGGCGARAIHLRQSRGTRRCRLSHRAERRSQLAAPRPMWR